MFLEVTKVRAKSSNDITLYNIKIYAVTNIIPINGHNISFLIN